MLAAAGRCLSGKAVAPTLQGVERGRGGEGDPRLALTVYERLLAGPDDGGALLGHHLGPPVANDDFAPRLTVGGDAIGALTRNVNGGVYRIDAQLVGLCACGGHDQLQLALDQL
jgi:hypothetical protein